MPTELPRPLLEIRYHDAAQAYLRSLPPEHFMEATAQARQREITVESLALVKTQRSDFYYFNELLVQYPLGRDKKIHQVVPDNMVVLSDTPIQAEGSYDVAIQPVVPFWVLVYVAKRNKRKDYEDDFRKYERGLRVPYYLLFYLDKRELVLLRRETSQYVSVPPNADGRHLIPELELEVGLKDGWVRYWYQGQLLPLPAELQRDLEQTRRQLHAVEEQLQRERQEKERERQEKERLLALLRQQGIDPG